MWKEYFLKKGNIYPVLKKVLNKNVKTIIITKPPISVQGIYHTRYFCKKGNLFWGLYFRRVVIFGGIATFGIC